LLDEIRKRRPRRVCVGGAAASTPGAARLGPQVVDALAAIARERGPGRVLISGTLYLAGEVLKVE
jgi:dihydrofolate synthase/folylpolyglutamate synthase